MADFTFSKTAGTVLLAHTQQATATVTVGSSVDVSTKLAARVFIGMGRAVATALTNEVLFKLQASAEESGDDDWNTINTVYSATGKTTANSTTLNGATSAGASTFVVTSATGITAGDMLYLRETGTPANSEWCEVKSMSSTTVTPFNNLTRSHTNSIAVTDLAERLTWTESLVGIKRLRLIVDTATSASGQTVDVIAWLVTLDKVVSV